MLSESSPDLVGLPLPAETAARILGLLPPVLIIEEGCIGQTPTVIGRLGSCTLPRANHTGRDDSGLSLAILGPIFRPEPQTLRLAFQREMGMLCQKDGSRGGGRG